MQIGHSEPRWTIPVVLIANSMSLLLYNVAGMFVTEEMGAVSRTVFESARTLFVWLGDLLLYYTHTGLGEKWDNSSYLQACLSFTPLSKCCSSQAFKPQQVPGCKCLDLHSCRSQSLHCSGVLGSLACHGVDLWHAKG